MSDQKKNLQPPQVEEELRVNAEREKAATEIYPDTEWAAPGVLSALREAFATGATWEYRRDKNPSRNRRVWLSLSESAEEYRLIVQTWLRLAEEAPTLAEKEKNYGLATRYEAVADRFQELADAEREDHS